MVSLIVVFLGVGVVKSEEIEATREDSIYTVRIPEKATLSDIYQSSQKSKGTPDDWSSMFTKEGNTYNCKGNITILPGGALTIKAGETLVMDCPSDDIYLICVKPGGTLRLAGKESSLARITSNDDYYYYEINLDKGDVPANLFINYGEISYMTQIFVYKGNVEIDHSHLHSSPSPGDEVPWEKSKSGKSGNFRHSALILYESGTAKITNSTFHDVEGGRASGILDIRHYNNVTIENCKLYEGVSALKLHRSNVTLINTTISELTNPESVAWTSGIGPDGKWGSQLTIKWLLNLKVVDKDKPVGEAGVKIENSSGEEVYAGVTNYKGYCRDILITQCTLKDLNENHHPNDKGEVTNYNPHLITVTKGDKTTKKVLKINSPEDIAISFGEETMAKL